MMALVKVLASVVSNGSNRRLAIGVPDRNRNLDLQALQEAGAWRTRFLLLAVLPLIDVDGIDLQIQFNRRVVQMSGFDDGSEHAHLLFVSKSPESIRA